MKKYIPSMYKKSIFDINYDKLKSIGIKCLIFDLDNTIALIDTKLIPEEVKTLFIKLKKDFNIVIISNNTKKRISMFCDPIDTTFVSFALKPLTFGFRKIKNKFNYKKEQMCMIGDQLMTDVLVAKRLGLYTILVEPIHLHSDENSTKFNRRLERFVVKQLKKRQLPTPPYLD